MAWFKNNAEFRMVDGETGIIFEAGQVTRSDETDWIKLQVEAKVLEEAENPHAALAAEDNSKRTRGQK